MVDWSTDIGWSIVLLLSTVVEVLPKRGAYVWYCGMFIFNATFIQNEDATLVYVNWECHAVFTLRAIETAIEGACRRLVERIKFHPYPIFPLFNWQKIRPVKQVDPLLQDLIIEFIDYIFRPENKWYICHWSAASKTQSVIPRYTLELVIISFNDIV